MKTLYEKLYEKHRIDADPPTLQVIGYFAEIAASSDKARDTSQVGFIDNCVSS